MTALVVRIHLVHLSSVAYLVPILQIHLLPRPFFSSFDLVYTSPPFDYSSSAYLAHVLSAFYLHFLAAFLSSFVASQVLGVY